jgi:bifunctional non-homologous end joining protein LigD
MSGQTECLVYYVFDLLAYDGVNLMDKPLIYRRELLEHILPTNNVIRFSDHIDAEGEQLFKAAQELCIEGIVAKHKDSTYQWGIRSKQ